MLLLYLLVILQEVQAGSFAKHTNETDWKLLGEKVRYSVGKSYPSESSSRVRVNTRQTPLVNLGLQLRHSNALFCQPPWPLPISKSPISCHILRTEARRCEFGGIPQAQWTITGEDKDGFGQGREMVSICFHSVHPKRKRSGCSCRTWVVFLRRCWDSWREKMLLLS